MSMVIFMISITIRCFCDLPIINFISYEYRQIKGSMILLIIITIINKTYKYSITERGNCYGSISLQVLRFNL